MSLVGLPHVVHSINTRTFMLQPGPSTEGVLMDFITAKRRAHGNNKETEAVALGLPIRIYRVTRVTRLKRSSPTAKD